MPSGKKKETSTTENKLNKDLQPYAVASLAKGDQAADLLQQTGYTGNRLADQDALIRQAQEQQLALAGEGGGLSNMVGQQQQAFSGLLGAGDLENGLFQRQLSDILEQSNTNFQRGSVPLFQQAAMAGQFGGSEGQEGLGLLGGEINRNMQQAITQAALGGQQTALQAQQLAPQSIGMGLMPSQIQQDIGGQRTQLAQNELQDTIQMQEAKARNAIEAQTYRNNFLSSNPLINAGSTTNTQEKAGASGLQTAMGIASIAAAPFTGGASLAGLGAIGGMGGGGGGGMLSGLSSVAPSLAASSPMQWLSNQATGVGTGYGSLFQSAQPSMGGTGGGRRWSKGAS